jgi:hypothetical protein
MDVKLKLIKLSMNEEFVLPKPSGESEDEFISRCMGDSTMNKEFPDEKQRAAVCYGQWRDR